MKKLDRNRLIELAGERAFRRGEEYFSWRRVRGLAVDGVVVSAFVDGARSYRVRLQREGGQIGHECNCPEGMAGRFCKHCVAVGLDWLETERLGGLAAVADGADLRAYLAGLTVEQMTELVLGQAAMDAQFRQRLRLRAARGCGTQPGLDEQRRLLEFAAQTAATTEDAAALSSTLPISPIFPIFMDVETALAGLLEEGFADQAARLIEDAPVFQLFGQTAGPAAGRTEAEERLIGLLLAYHRKSWRQMGIAPEAIARRLLDWQLRCGAAARGELTDSYADLLGRQGRKVYQQLAQAEWQRLHADGNAHSAEQRERCARLAALIEHSANKRGDIAALIAIKSRHPSDAGGYLEIARLCRRMGDDAQAAEWARRGAQQLPAFEAVELNEFLAELHEARGDWKEALASRFAQFQARPSLRDYQKIADCARRAGEWALWRERALSVLQRANDPAETSRPANARASVLSVLVSILLWENEDEAAWQAARQAQPDSCSDDLWQEIAQRRAKEYPEDALLIYKRLVAKYASRKNRYSYEMAVKTLRRIGRLLSRRKRQEEFVPYVESLCRQHRYQHAFIKMLRQLADRHSRRIAVRPAIEPGRQEVSARRGPFEQA